MSKIEEVKKAVLAAKEKNLTIEVDPEYALALVNYVEAAEAWFVELECAQYDVDPKLTKARRALGLEG